MRPYPLFPVPYPFFRHGKKTLDFGRTQAGLGIGAGGIMCTEVRMSWTVVGARRSVQLGSRKVYFLWVLLFTCAITGLGK